MWSPRLGRSTGPRYLAIATAIGDDIAAGRLAVGQRLPTHRDLADSLGVTVGTVSRAYAIAIERGLITGEVGRGTFVRGSARRASMPALGVLAPPDHEDRSTIDLGLNYMRLPEHADRYAQTLVTLAARPDLAGLFDEYKPQAGAPRHRAAGARWLANSRLEVTTDRVLVCSGAQHALTVALLGTTRAGDVIAMESVSYPGMMALARSLERTMVAVAMDDDGLIPESLEAVCRSRHPKALYCMPSVQNPTARVMSLRRREQIAEIAARHRIAVIEDDVYGFLAEGALPPISSLVPELGHFVSACTKSVAPGLRVGFLAVPPGDAGRFVEHLWATAVMVSPLTAEISAHWIEDGTALELADARRKEARARQQLARGLLGDAALAGDPGAFHLWLPVPHTSTATFVAAAQHRGVIVVPGEAFAVGSDVPAAVRVSLGPPRDHAALARGITVLADLLRDDARWIGV